MYILFTSNTDLKGLMIKDIFQLTMFGIDRSNWDLLNSTGNSAEYSVRT